jgi:hypothetical protein
MLEKSQNLNEYVYVWQLESHYNCEKCCYCTNMNIDKSKLISHLFKFQVLVCTKTFELELQSYKIMIIF